MVWSCIAHGIKTHLIVVEDSVTAVRHGNEILRPVAVPLV